MAERFASATEPADADIVVSVASTADGVTRLLETCSPRSRLVHISSALVYGPQPSGTTAALGEDSPLHPVPNHHEAVDLAEAERLLVRARSAGRAVCVLRPAATAGTTFFSLAAHGRIGVRGADPRYQFLHSHDFLAAVAWAVDGDVAGVYNVAPGDDLAIADIDRRGRHHHRLRLPPDAARRVTTRLAAWRVSHVGPQWLPYLSAPPRLDASRAAADGFACRHGSIDALEEGLAAVPPRAVPAAVPVAAGMAGAGVALWLWARHRRKS